MWSGEGQRLIPEPIMGMFLWSFGNSEFREFKVCGYRLNVSICGQAICIPH